MAGRKFRSELELRGNTKGVKKAFDKAGRSTDGLVKKFKLLGAAAATAAVGKIFLGTADKIREFEKSISDLSAITGATGADLDKLERASKRIGQTTTLSASQAAEAFKLMASAKPDLLANLDALEATTEAAVTLAEAAGIELPIAAEALGNSLNQFGKGADEAGRFIDILAAGSKFGASSIDDISKALVNAGTQSRLSGLSFTETNAALQALASGGLKGSIAGSKLRAVLVKLTTQTNDAFNPAVVGINAALANLDKANLSATDKFKLFGAEVMSTADLLILQRGTVDELEEKLDGPKGLNAAYDQAKTRTQNLDGSLKRLGSAYEAIQLSFGDSVGPMTMIVDLFGDIFNTLAKLNSSSEPGGISVVGGLFDAFAFSLKTVFTAGAVLKNVLDTLIDMIGLVGAVLIDLVTFNFDLIDDRFKEFQTNVEGHADDIGDAVVGVWNPELAAEMDANMRAFFQDPIIAVATETGAAIDKALAPETAGAQAIREAAERHIKSLDAKLERIRTANFTEIQLEQDAWAKRVEVLQAGLMAKDLTQKQFDEQLIAEAQLTAELFDALQAAEVEKHIVELDAKLERIRVSNLTELDIENQAWADRIEILAEGLLLKRLTQEEFDEQLIEAAQRTADRITAIQAKAGKTDKTFAEMTAKQKTQSVLGEALRLTSGVAQQSKAMFKINKVAGIANAVINTAQSITEMMKLPWPLNLAMAALAAAAGAAQIAAIKSTTFSGGGSGTTPSLAGSAGTINSIPVGGLGGGGGADITPLPGVGTGVGTGQRIDINIEGLDDAGFLPASAVRDLIDSIGEELGEGVSLNVSGGG